MVPQFSLYTWFMGLEQHAADYLIIYTSFSLWQVYISLYHTCLFYEALQPRDVKANVATGCRVCILFCKYTGSPEGTNSSVVLAVSWKEACSFFWWLTENREALPKADEVTGLRLCFCCRTMTSYLPGGVRLSSPCNCDLSEKTRPLSRRQIEAQRSDSLGFTSVAAGCMACLILMWSQC